MGSCQNDQSSADQLCLSPRFYGLCSCGVSWIWSCWSNGKPACQWKQIKYHRTVWLKPDQRYDEEQLFPLGSCVGWGLSVMWGWILTSCSGSLWLKHALDLYSSTCFHADLCWEEREPSGAPSLWLCNQYPLFFPLPYALEWSFFAKDKVGIKCLKFCVTLNCNDRINIRWGESLL